MVAKRSKRKVKATKEPPIREGRRTSSRSTAVRGGAKRKAGTVKEDKRTPLANNADEKNRRKDHDKATYELEASEGRPSRKSTRRGANRVKANRASGRKESKTRRPRHVMEIKWVNGATRSRQRLRSTL